MIYREEYYRIVGICMEVHRILGGGLSEVIYKDALEHEFRQQGIVFYREKTYSVIYKGKLLAHLFYADFVMYHNIVLEVKAVREIGNEHIAQTINYIRLSKGELGIIVNFSMTTLQHKRIVL